MQINPLILLAGSVSGVGLLVAVCALLGGWRTARLVSVDDARARLAAELPELRVDDWWLAPDGLGALAFAADEVVVVAVLGDGTAVRRLARPVAVVDGRLRLHDLGFPDVAVPADVAARLR